MEITSFLTVDLLRKVASQFDWPCPWELKADLPDGITMQFPKSHLYFREGYDGEIELQFLTVDTQTPSNLKLIHALQALYPPADREPGPLVAGLIRDFSPQGSEAKVRNQVHDLCKIAVEKLSSVLEGDFSWVQSVNTPNF